MLKFIEQDPWLWPSAHKIERRYRDYLNTLKDIETREKSLYHFAGAYLYYGLHFDRARKLWIFREYLPKADKVFICGDFNGWDLCSLALKPLGDGNWEIELDPKIINISEGSRYKIYIYSHNEWKLRMPAYCFSTVQDPISKDFAAVVFDLASLNEDQAEQGLKFEASSQEVLIYEAHIGMAQEKYGVGTFKEFEKNILPNISGLGYTVIQLMGIAEHPYYASFGYHVSNFYAPSSRFGSPQDFKDLVAAAHKLGIRIIIDLVHAHFVSNVNEGLYALDGDPDFYNYPGERGVHPYWDSMIFDYGKAHVRKFLLSNLRYWMEVFHVDGFRFDGVTSMLYHHRGYIDDFASLENYFGKDVDINAVIYLSLANHLMKEIDPSSLSIAEEVSGMPGLAVPISDGGMGFDFRLAMGIPDFWIKMIKEQADEAWSMEAIWKHLNDHLPAVKQVAYCESHDQALVGDQTLAFRLMGEKMYHDMHKDSKDIIIERGMAFHKMIRMLSLSLGGNAWLNFMGNEFGHPEWIDFPREGNQDSYQYARRQWSLLEDKNLKYNLLWNFDKAMIHLAKEISLLSIVKARLLFLDEENKSMVFDHNDGQWIFVFNWHWDKCIASYAFPIYRPGKFSLYLCSDDLAFGGFARVDTKTEYFSQALVAPNDNGACHELLVYNVNRCVQVFKLLD